ncbi:hypothetical protein ACN47E_003967 [Coniothyrium glycines]
MKTSKYAPITPAGSLAQSKAEQSKRGKERAARLLGRVRWKAELLMVSYFRTMEIVRSSEQHNHILESGATSKQAESMFKVDFFEFYTLLERFITDCLAVLDFRISAAAPVNVNFLRYVTNPDLHRTRPLATHAFHANLLEAIDDTNCPLHTTLGIQEVRVQLGIAKDFRNAWKDADSSTVKKSGVDHDPRDVKLQDLQLETMLRAIIMGCDQAHAIVQTHTDRSTNGIGLTSRDFEAQLCASGHVESTDTPFEYMDDAMELD